MIHSVRRKLRSALTMVLRFYLSATGVVLLAAVVAGVILGLAVSSTLGWVVVAVVGGTVVPYRLMSLERARITSTSALTRVRDVPGRLQKVEQHLKGGGSVDNRLLSLRRDLLGSIATVRDEVGSLLRSERRLWTDAVDGVRGDVDAKVEASSDDIASAEARLGARVDEVGERSARSIEQVRATLDARLAQETRQVLLSVARHDALSIPVDRVLLLIAAERTGSARLFDSMRCHPRISMRPAADLTRALGVAGRRYPAHLTDLPGADIVIEVHDGLGGRIPAFDVFEAPSVNGHDENVGRFVIEKVHPSAIRFDVETFAARVGALRSRLGGDERVTPIYLMRDPVDSIGSFIARRRQEPRWHSDVPIAFVHDFYRRSYETIVEIHARLPGPVVTCESLSADGISSLARLFLAVGVESVESEARRIASLAASSLARSAHGSVLGRSREDLPSRAEVELGVDSHDPGRAQQAVARCREICRALSCSSVDAG